MDNAVAVKVDGKVYIVQIPSQHTAQDWLNSEGARLREKSHCVEIIGKVEGVIMPGALLETLEK